MNPPLGVEMKIAPVVKEVLNPVVPKENNPMVFLQTEQSRCTELASGISGGIDRLAGEHPNVDLSQEKRLLVKLSEELQRLAKDETGQLVKTIFGDKAETTIGGKPFTLADLTTEQLLQLQGAVDRIQANMPPDFEWDRWRERYMAELKKKREPEQSSIEEKPSGTKTDQVK